jgi:hypothetical protein
MHSDSKFPPEITCPAKWNALTPSRCGEAAPSQRLGIKSLHLRLQAPVVAHEPLFSQYVTDAPALAQKRLIF